MNRKSLVVALLFCAAGVMAAQETPRFDLFGGYSYGRISSHIFSEPGNLNGWDSSFTYNVNSWLGIVAEGSGHYGSRPLRPAANIIFVCQPPTPCPPSIVIGPSSVDQKLHTYVFGPRFTWRTGRAVTPFGHVLVGAGHTTDSIDFGFGRVTLHSDAMVWKFGGGFDLRLNSLASWRTQTDLIHSHFFSSNQNNFQLSTGPVFHFGRK